MLKISVLMSVHNENPIFLKESIESILSQSFFDFEFIIIDDGSATETSNVLKEYAKTDSRISLVHNNSNLGLTKSLNIGIKKSQGAFIARMDSDDISTPDRLKKQLTFILENNFDLIGADCDIINDEGKTLKQGMVPPYTHIKKALMKGNFFIHSTFFGKRAIFEELYNENFKRAQDYEFLLRTAGRGYKIGHLRENVLKYRINTESISVKKASQQELFALRARMLAISKYGYSYFFLPYLMRSALVLMIPYRIKRYIIYKILK